MSTIHERCHRCQTELTIGLSLQNTFVGIPDFIWETASEVCTVSQTGPPELINCLKCPNCGTSYEIKVGVKPPDGATAEIELVTDCDQLKETL